MKLILATGNKGKLREFKQMCQDEVVPFSELLGEFDIIEDGDTFAANALIKARTIYDKLRMQDVLGDYMVVSDDSGISLPILGGAPGIYSARYAGVNVTDKDNLYKHGWKNHVNWGPIRESIAASILHQSKILQKSDNQEKVNMKIWDPLCGSGTFGLVATTMIEQIPVRSDV